MKHRIEALFRHAGPNRVWLVAVLLSAAALTTSCAYYNTFFFARRYYNQAVKASRQPTKSGPGGTSQPVGITGQASSLLDKAIEKCAKVITFYPKSKWVDDAIYLMGESYYLKQDYDKALKKFTELPVYYPKSEYVPRSMFMVGLCEYGKKEYDQSIESLEKALAEYPRAGGQERASAMFTLGEAYWQKKSYAEALVSYRLLAGGKRSEFRFKSLLKAGQCYFELARYDSARVCFAAVVDDDKNDEEVLDALIRIGDAYAAEKNLDAASRSYQQAMLLAQDFAKVPAVKLKMADVELAKENYKKAIELYRSVVADFPRTAFASEAQFRMGYIYEVYLEELDKAAEAYSKVREQLAKSEFTSQAELRGKGLARLKESGKKQGASEADKKAEPDFILAELSLFQLGKPDKAIEKYLTVERNFPTSVYAPKAAFAAAYAFLHMKNDTASAIETGRRVIEKFPNTDYAEAAGKMLTSLNVEMSPELLQKTIPPEPVRADTLKAAAAQLAAGAAPTDSLLARARTSADSLRARERMAADSLRAAARTAADSLKTGTRTAADSVKAGTGSAAREVLADSLKTAQTQTARADTVTAGSAPSGATAPSADSLRSSGSPADSLKTVPPAGTTTDTTAVPHVFKPEYPDEYGIAQDTSAAR